MATNLLPDREPLPWMHKNMLNRVDCCRAMLKVHGFLSDSENVKVRRRIRAWVKRMQQTKS